MRFFSSSIFPLLFFYPWIETSSFSILVDDIGLFSSADGFCLFSLSLSFSFNRAMCSSTEKSISRLVTVFANNARSAATPVRRREERRSAAAYSLLRYSFRSPFFLEPGVAAQTASPDRLVSAKRIDVAPSFAKTVVMLAEQIEN